MSAVIRAEAESARRSDATGADSSARIKQV
jgi:hypothetical protein